MIGVRPLRYLALGDSYTIGEGVDEASRWPVQLTLRLRSEGVPVSDPEIIAMSGWTTDELDAALVKANPRGPYNLVSLLIGVNNQYRGRELGEYRLQFVGLLRQAMALAGGVASRVLVVSIPDWSVSPFANGRDRKAIASEIDDFNQSNREEAEHLGAAYVNITTLSRTQGRMVVADGLHPNAEAYSAWTELVLPVARQMLPVAGNAS